MTGFTAIPALSWWPEAEPTVSDACLYFAQLHKVGEGNTVIYVTYNQVDFFYCMYFYFEKEDHKQCQTSYYVISKEKIRHIEMNKESWFLVQMLKNYDLN